jgi:hypothetical protein
MAGCDGRAAVVAGAAYAIVVVAGEGGDAAAAYFVDDLIGPDIVSYQVAQTVDGIGLLVLDAYKQCFEGGEVGVYVAEQGNFHGCGVI